MLGRVLEATPEWFDARGEGQGHHHDAGRDTERFPKDSRAVGVEEGFVEVFFAHEAEEERQPGHGERGDQCGRCGEGHGTTQPAKMIGIARAGFVVDRAGGHEERGFVERVGQQVGQRRFDRQLRADTEQHGQRAEHRDRGVSEDFFEVVLTEGQEDTGHHGQRPDRRDDRHPERTGRQKRMQSREEKDARFHHGSRVQIRTDRRRRFHRVGQPEMERELGRLGEGAEQNQDENRGEAGLRDERRRIHGEELGDAESSSRASEQDDARQHAESARTRDEQGLQGRGTRLRFVVVVADEQVGRNAGQLPENEEQHEVIGTDHAEHRAHETEEVEIEFPEILFARQIARRIPRDIGPDHGDEQEEEQAQPVGAEVQIDAQRRHPRVLPDHGLPRSHARDHHSVNGRGSQRHQTKDQPATVAQTPVQPGREARGGKNSGDGADKECGHVGRSSRRSGKEELAGKFHAKSRITGHRPAIPLACRRPSARTATCLQPFSRSRAPPARQARG